MQIINKIDQLITKLNNLKPELSNDSLSNEKKFNALLKTSIESSNAISAENQEIEISKNAKLEGRIPSWVNSDYPYDPENPRKPKMRELMEAISGKSIEDLYCEGGENCQRVIRQASEMLYGVVGSNKDTRDWQSIMISENILKEAQKETGNMYDPEVNIISSVDTNGVLNKQIAVLKDKNGIILRSISSDTTIAEETLNNFGVKRGAIPTNLEDQVDPDIFDNDLLTFLKNFDNNPTSIENVVFQNASEVIANRLSQEIPLDELAKL